MRRLQPLFAAAVLALAATGAELGANENFTDRYFREYPDLVRWSSFDDALKLAEQRKRSVLLLFTNQHCGPCIGLHLAILSEPTGAALITDGFAPVKIMGRFSPKDVVTKEDEALVKRFKVKGYPTFLVVSYRGEELARGGWAGRDATLTFLRRHASLSSPGTRGGA